MAQEGVLYSSNRKYPNQAEQPEQGYLPLVVEVKELPTALLLLQSNEDEVILKVLHSLSIYLSCSKENAANLMRESVLEKLLKESWVTASNILIQRFALKICAELLSVEKAACPRSVLMGLYSKTRDQFLYSKDSFVLEYCATIIAKSIEEAQIRDEVEADEELFIGVVFYLLKNSDDPDILFNSYKITYEVLASGNACAEVIRALPPLETMLSHLKADYVEIQAIVLQCLKEMVEQKIPSHFEKCVSHTFVDEIFQIMNPNSSQNLTALACEVLAALLSHEDASNSFCEEGFLKQFVRIFEENSISKSGMLIVLSQIAGHAKGPKYLFDIDALRLVFEMVRDKEENHAELYNILMKVASYTPAQSPIIEAGTLDFLIDVIKNDVTKTGACEALYSVLNNIVKLQSHGSVTDFVLFMASHLKKGVEKVGVSFLLAVVKVISLLGENPRVRENISRKGLAECLAEQMKLYSHSSTVCAALLQCLGLFANEEDFQNELMKRNIHEILTTSLRNSSVSVKTAACDFIVLTGSSPKYNATYVCNGVLEELISNDSALATCPSWSSAIESILSGNASIKFAIRGRLDLHDMVTDDFYLSKFNFKDFKILLDIMRDEVSPRHTVILVNFNLPICPESTIVHVSAKSEGRCAESGDSTDEYDYTYCRRPCDRFLPEYLDRIAALLKERGFHSHSGADQAVDITELKDYFRLVAQFVSAAMRGNQEGPHPSSCNELLVSSHLNDIKCSLHCNIIPLGLIRCGGKTERALLYKALCDRLCLPCVLQRSGAILYNEVPIPKLDSDACKSNLPKRLLRPTHIVNLMEMPGEFYRIPSKEFYEYTKILQ